MSGDLKQELMDTINAAESEYASGPEAYAHYAELRARLQRATVTEPGPFTCIMAGPEGRLVRFKQRAAGDPWSFAGFVNPDPVTGSAPIAEPAPDFPLSDSTFNKLTTTKVMGKSLLGWIQTLHDMEQMYMPPRADAPAPTDALSEAELRERLQAALPGWSVEVGNGEMCWAKVTGWPRVAVPYAALRKPGGIEACARALRVLAGVEGE